MKALPGILALLICSAVLAGCSDDGDEPQVDDLAGEVEELKVTSTTGGIRGVVVDQSIRPVAGATVTIRQTGDTTTTDAGGLYAISDLPAGTYIVEATHALYNSIQQTVDVVAGVAEPKPTNFQLERLISQDPYMVTIKEVGFIACSLNVVVFLSEECGEGVGVPGVGRVGQNPANRAQIDFNVDNENIAFLVLEQVWTPSLELSAGGGEGAMDTRVALDWSCDPVCGGNTLNRTESASPLRITVPQNALADNGVNGDTVLSTFTWAADDLGILLNQEFELFISSFYFLEPLNKEWSFVGGDEPPF